MLKLKRMEAKDVGDMLENKYGGRSSKVRGGIDDVSKTRIARQTGDHRHQDNAAVTSPSACKRDWGDMMRSERAGGGGSDGTGGGVEGGNWETVLKRPRHFPTQEVPAPVSAGALRNGRVIGNTPSSTSTSTPASPWASTYRAGSPLDRSMSDRTPAIPEPASSPLHPSFQPFPSPSHPHADPASFSHATHANHSGSNSIDSVNAPPPFLPTMPPFNSSLPPPLSLPPFSPINLFYPPSKSPILQLQSPLQLSPLGPLSHTSLQPQQTPATQSPSPSDMTQWLGHYPRPIMTDRDRADAVLPPSSRPSPTSSEINHWLGQSPKQVHLQLQPPARQGRSIDPPLSATESQEERGGKGGGEVASVSQHKDCAGGGPPRPG